MKSSHSTRPHIVIFNPDSFRGDVLGHLGNAGAVTPNLDAMVAQGAVSYANAFAQNPGCTPSRCSFMTGQYPHTRGHRSMKYMLREDEPHLLKVLKREGYHVWWGGKNDLVAVKEPNDYFKHCSETFVPAKPTRISQPSPTDIAEDDPRYTMYYRGVREGDGAAWPYLHRDGLIVRGAVDHIAKADTDEPMCVFLTIGCPHPAYEVEQTYYDQIDPAALPPRLPVPAGDHPAMTDMRRLFESEKISDEDWLEIRRVYYAMCTKVDDMFGQVVQALKDKGIYDNTLIIFMSDHGDLTGDYDLPEKPGVSLADALLRVPLVIKPPADWAMTPGVRDAAVELVDLCPTIYDMLAIEPGYDTQGQSLAGNLAGDQSNVRPCIFAEAGTRPGEKAYYLSEVLDMPPRSFYRMKLDAMDPYFKVGTYNVMARTHDYKYIRSAYQDYMALYDLQNDPGELKNLANDPAYAKVQQRMEKHVTDHLLRTTDVLPHDVDSRKVRHPPQA